MIRATVIVKYKTWKYRYSVQFVQSSWRLCKFYGKCVVNIRCVINFSPQLLFKTFLILINIQKVTSEIRIEINIGLHIKWLLKYLIKMQTEVLLWMFVKFTNIKFHENLPTCPRVVSCIQMDGWKHWENLTGIPQGCEYSYKGAQISHIQIIRSVLVSDFISFLYDLETSFFTWETTEIEFVGEWSVKENIWTRKRWSNWRIKKIT